MIKIAPSLLAADIAAMGEDARKIEAVSELLHVDVMDGHFVPNLSFGVPVVAAMKKVTGLVMDVHLMIDNPLSYVEKFIKAGADIVTVHIEAPDSAAECIDLIHSLGKKAGVALNPNTDPGLLAPVIDRVDMVLQMTVFPGFGGQSMVKEALDNLPVLRRMLGPERDLQVDGGIYIENCFEVASRGANVIVAGTGIFGQDDPAAAARLLRRNAEESAPR